MASALALQVYDVLSLIPDGVLLARLSKTCRDLHLRGSQDIKRLKARLKAAVDDLFAFLDGPEVQQAAAALRRMHARLETACPMFPTYGEAETIGSRLMYALIVGHYLMDEESSAWVSMISPAMHGHFKSTVFRRLYSDFDAWMLEGMLDFRWLLIDMNCVHSCALPEMADRAEVKRVHDDLIVFYKDVYLPLAHRLLAEFIDPIDCLLRDGFGFGGGLIGMGVSDGPFESLANYPACVNDLKERVLNGVEPVFQNMPIAADPGSARKLLVYDDL